MYKIKLESNDTTVENAKKRTIESVGIRNALLYTYRMKLSEYETLRAKRNELIELSKKATLPKHLKMIDEQLSGIREQLKQAHKAYKTK